ncbi:MAG: TIGR00153 family protein [Candidatus Hadarchaeum sp.]|uniref:TIGR00153 family protein n=1 Tax=Candidatus Hadarchaeum sp. TaxID=2883567 RepID=UPI003D097C3D
MEVLSISIIGGGKEQRALEILKRNAKAVTGVVKKFEEVITAYFTDLDFDRAEKLGRELSKLETAADKGKREFMKVLGEGAFLPAFRADLAWLAERLDTVADTAEGAMRVLLLRKQLLQALIRGEGKNREIREWRLKFAKMARVTTQTVQILEEAIEALTTDIGEATRKANDVDLLEHEIDLMEQSLTNDLYSFEKVLDPVSIIQLADIIRRSANVSDRAEDMSDTVTILGFTLTG